MNERERKRLIALPIVLAIAAGLAWAGSQHGERVGGVALFALCVGIAFAIQWIAFVPAYLKTTEKYFDLTGSLTYLTVTGVAVLLGSAPDLRSWLLAGAVVIWAARLGSFLYRRIHAAGKDGRFDDIRTSAIRFFTAWTLQGLWVSVTAGAALAAITSTRRLDMGLLAWIGLTLWVAGLSIEVVADRQKSRFRARDENEGRFINAGLWAWSRHPNYFGEIVLWIGVALMASEVLQGWQYVTLISPLFVYLLLTKVSGIPMLEERADDRWGGQPDYEAYKAATPVLIPRPPSST